jgi:hypothetical protein
MASERGFVEFEWDAAKSERCRQLRDFDFAYAARIFGGPVVSRPDHRREYGEIRIVATGRVASNVLTVVYTDRGSQRRIISARKANSRERKAFEASLGPDAVANHGRVRRPGEA